MSLHCTHQDQINPVFPTTPGACEECLQNGDAWVHLRVCLACGHVGCCDASKNTHAIRHYHETGHPIIQSLEPGEGWIWCYVDEIILDVGETSAEKALADKQISASATIDRTERNGIPMHAIHAFAKNDPSQLRYEQSSRPELLPGDVLVRIVASGVTPSELSWPTTWIAPDNTPRPLPIIPGHEISGIVESITSTVLDISVGDEVFGLIDFQRDGADADFVAARATELAPKPISIDHIQTAAVPLSALTAWQALFDQGQIEKGQLVLIHGAAGGVGSFAVQLAHWRGARVICTASQDNAGQLRDLGADEVIDYKSTDFEEQVHNADLVFDTVGGETWERSWNVLRTGGKLVSVAVPLPPERTPTNDIQAIWFVVQQNREQLSEIAHLIDAGFIRPIVSLVLPLARAQEAYGHGERHRGMGKIVLQVANGDHAEQSEGAMASGHVAAG